jgi:hypothetical protein
MARPSRIPAEDGPARGARRGQHEDRGGGDPGRDHVHMGAVARLEDHQRTPGPQRGRAYIPAQAAQAEQQQHRGQDGDQRGGGLNGCARVAARRQVMHPEEIRLGHRRVDRGHGRPVDGRAARGQFGGRMADHVGLRHAVLGAGVEEELIPQPGELTGRRDVGVRVDARRLDSSVPDVAVQVVAVLRRRGHRGQLEADAAEQDRGDRGPARHLAQQPDRDDEHQPRADQQRQRPYPGGIETGTHEQQHQAGHHDEGQADRGHAEFCVHAG